MRSNPKLSRFRARLAGLTLLAASTMLTGCVNATQAEVGRILGGISGAIIGSEISDGDTGAIILGGFLGAYLGGEIGASLDEEDHRLMSMAVIFVLDHGGDGYSKSWRNRHTHHYGHFTAHSTYRNAQHVECRRFTNTIFVGNHPHRRNGTACRQRDGNWSILY